MFYKWILILLFLTVNAQAYLLESERKLVPAKPSDFIFDYESYSKKLLNQTNSRIDDNEFNSQKNEAKESIIAASKILQQRLSIKQKRADRVATLVIFAAKKYKIDPRYMLAIIKVESNFKSDARNTFSCKGNITEKCGDHSLVQINYNIWKKAFLKKGRVPLDFKKLKNDEAYAVFRMAEILSILKTDNPKDPHWYAMYHSNTPKHKNPYRAKVDKEYEKIKEINPSEIFQKIGSL